MSTPSDNRFNSMESKAFEDSITRHTRGGNDEVDYCRCSDCHKNFIKDDMIQDNGSYYCEKCFNRDIK